MLKPDVRVQGVILCLYKMHVETLENGRFHRDKFRLKSCAVRSLQNFASPTAIGLPLMFPKGSRGSCQAGHNRAAIRS